MKKILFLLLLPSLALADRLGSLRSNAEVLLTTQAVTSSTTTFIRNQSTLQSGASFYVHLGSATSLISGTYTSNMYDPTGVFIDPAGIILNRQASTNNCIRYSADGDDNVTAGAIAFELCRNGANLHLGQASITGGVSPVITLSADGQSGVGHTTATLQGITFINGGQITYGNPVNPYIVTYSTISSGVAPYAASISTNGLISGIGLLASGLASGECVQTTTGGRLTTTGAACGSGGGGSGSPIAFTTGTASTYSNPAVSSPMIVGVLNLSQFGITASGTTGYINITPALNTIATATTTIVGSYFPVKIGSGTIGGFDVSSTSTSVTGSAGLYVSSNTVLPDAVFTDDGIVMSSANFQQISILTNAATPAGVGDLRIGSASNKISLVTPVTGTEVGAIQKQANGDFAITNSQSTTNLTLRTNSATRMTVQPGGLIFTGGSFDVRGTSASVQGSGGLGVTYGVVAGSGTFSDLVSGSNFKFDGPELSTVTYGLAVGSLTVNGASAGEVQLAELPANGGNYVSLKASDTIATSFTLVLPDADGSANQSLVTDGNGNLSFATVSGSAGGDDLGSHIATMTVTANYGITGTTLTISSNTVLPDATFTDDGIVMSSTTFQQVSIITNLATPAGVGDLRFGSASNKISFVAPVTGTEVGAIQKQNNGDFAITNSQSTTNLTLRTNSATRMTIQPGGLIFTGTSFDVRGTSASVQGSGGLGVTYGITAGSVTVGGQSVCLEDGTDCPAAGSGDMVLATTQTVTAQKIFTSTRAVVIQPVGDLGVTTGANAYGTDGAFIFDVSASTGLGMVLYNNAAQTVSTANSMLSIISTNTAYGGYFLRIIRNDSNSNGDIRIDSPNPNIEMKESDLGNNNDSFEVGINNSLSYWGTRNANNDSFERIFDVARISSGPYISLKATGTIRFEDLQGSYIGFHAGDNSASWVHEWWTTPNNVGKVLKQTANGGDRPLAWDNTIGVAGSSITFSSSVAITTDLRVGGSATVNNQLVCTADGTNCPASGGGSGSPIAFTTGTYASYSNPAISTPMLVGVFRAGQFTVRASGTTGYFELDGTSVTLAGNTFNGASQLVQLNGSSQLPAVSGALLTNLPAANLTGVLPGLATSYIQNGSTLQTATFNVSSGTVGNFRATDSTMTNVTTDKIILNGQGNTRVVYMNGTALGTSSTFTWNGTTITAPSLYANGASGATATYGVTVGSLNVTGTDAINMTGSDPTIRDGSDGKIVFQSSTRQLHFHPSSEGMRLMQLEDDIASGGTDHTDTVLTLFGRSGTGAVSDYFSSQLNMGSIDGSNAATAYSMGTDGSWTGAGGFQSNTHWWVYDLINGTTFLRNSQADAEILEIGDHIQTKGIAMGQVGRTLTTSDVNDLAGVLKSTFSITPANDTNARNWYGMRIRGLLNATGTTANKTLYMADIDTVNTSTNGVNVVPLRVGYGGNTQFMVNSSSAQFAYGVAVGSIAVTDSMKIPTGTGPTVDATGECAMDTTDGAIVCYDGETAKVVAHSTHSATVTISSGTGWGGLSLVVWRAPHDMAATITKISAETLTAGTTVMFQLDETTFGSTASAGTDVFSVQFSSAHNQGVTTTSFANASIAAGSSLVLNTPAAGAAGGAPAGLTFTIYYLKERE